VLIGEKLKQIRKTRHLSLTELSKRSGVQLATLSRMENLKMTGTLQSHMNIAKALGVDLAKLYSDVSLESTDMEVKTPIIKGDIFLHSDKSAYEMLTGGILTKKMMPVLLKLAANGQTGMEQNQSGTEKFIFVLEGEIEVQIEKEKYHLVKSNSLYFDASLRHRFMNKGREPARVLCVTTPVAL